MTGYKLIVNPVAGMGGGEAAVPRVEQFLRGRGVRFDLVRTERPWHAAELAREAATAGYEVVVAVGGDGTVNEVLNGLMAARQPGRRPNPALGVLCVGRGNDFAYGVGLPTDLEVGCRALAAGRRRTIDVGRVVGGLYPQGRYFGNGVGIGFDAVVGFVAAKSRLTGFTSYLVAAVKTVFLYYKAPQVRIEYDDQVLDQRSLLISIMNGRRMGGGFHMAPQSRPDDGVFDLCIARQVSRLRIFSLIPHFMRGTQATQKEILIRRAQRVTVTALEGTLAAHADGETICTEGDRLDMELLAAQVEILCPPPEAAC